MYDKGGAFVTTFLLILYNVPSMYAICNFGTICYIDAFIHASIINILQ